MEVAKKLPPSSSLVVAKCRYASVVAELVAAIVRCEPLNVCDTNQSLQCLDLTGFMALTRF